MYGADVDPGGEEVLLSVGQQQVANQRPVPAFDLTYDVSLQVTDDRGDSECLTKRFAAIDVKPGAEVATVNPTSSGFTPVAVLAFDGFDVTALDLAELRCGDGIRQVHAR